MARDLEEQLVKYLTDAHAMEVQALAQMRAAPRIAGDAKLADAFSAHLAETERHEQLVRERLDAHGASPSRLEDLLGALSGKGFVLFARFNPDTPGKLATHAFSYEHLELATYDLLERVAERAHDEETARVARTIRAEEDEMSRRLSALWDVSAAASGEDVGAYLADAHALEAQSVELLKRGRKIAGETELARLFEEHLAESEEHKRLIEARGETSRVKDAALRLGALNWGGFFASQRDTPAKLAAFAYAFEHLEIAGYEHLRRLGDPEATALADRILPEERAAAEKLYAAFEPALNASLDAVVSA
jgi:ferritin-like metal-binding protein YciE